MYRPLNGVSVSLDNANDLHLLMSARSLAQRWAKSFCASVNFLCADSKMQGVGKMGSEQDMVRVGELARRLGTPVRLAEQGPDRSPDQSPLFQGRLSWQQLRPGLSLHCSDCLELHDFSTQVEVSPRLSLVLFMNGDGQAQYDDRRLQVAPRPGRPEGIAIALTEPATFTRQAHSGQHIRKLSICLTPEWFASSGLDAHISIRRLIEPRQHLALRRWTPTASLLALAEQVMGQPAEGELLGHLQQEVRVLGLVHGVVEQLVGEPTEPVRQRPHHQRLVQRAQELLHSGEADGWSLEQIASAVGASASTLQRQFQAAQGMSLFAWQRQRKLQQAHVALQSGVSISEAAWQAGYSSTANFTTAFRRQFGMTPQRVQKFY